MPILNINHDDEDKKSVNRLLHRVSPTIKNKDEKQKFKERSEKKSKPKKRGGWFSKR